MSTSLTLTETNSSALISIMGYNFDWLTNVFLSSSEVTFPSLTAVNRFTNLRRVSAICLPFSGYEISSYTTIGRNNITITATADMWNPNLTGFMDIIFLGPAGYSKLSDINYLIEAI